MEEAGFSYNKTIYDADGSSAQLTIRMPHGTDPKEFSDLIHETMAALSSGNGVTTAHKDLNPGEKLENISGWVLGQKSGGQPVVWIYGPEHLQFRLDTIWHEHIGSTPFADAVEHAKQWPTASAPKRDEAISAGYFNECSCKAVMGPHPGGRTKKDSTDPLIVTLRWHGHDAPAPPDPVHDNRPSIRINVDCFESGEEVAEQALLTKPGELKAQDFISFIESWASVSVLGAETDRIASFIDELVDQRYIRSNTGFALLSKLGEPVNG